MEHVISEYSKDTLTLRVRGEIDHHSAKEVREQADRAICLYRAKEVCLDLSEVEFMDSSGLGLILGRHAKAAELGGRLTVLNPSARVERILTLAGTERLIPIRREKGGEKPKAAKHISQKGRL